MATEQRYLRRPRASGAASHVHADGTCTMTASDVIDAVEPIRVYEALADQAEVDALTQGATLDGAPAGLEITRSVPSHSIFYTMTVGHDPIPAEIRVWPVHAATMLTATVRGVRLETNDAHQGFWSEQFFKTLRCRLATSA